MLVHELMTREVVTVRPETSIREAALTLLGEEITAAPVVYENGTVVAIVSRRDLVAGRVTEDPRAHLGPAHRELGEPPHLVRQVMTRDIVSAAPGDESAHVAEVMVRGGFASLPVIDHNKLVGMISVTDILRSLTHSDDAVAEALRLRLFEYGESHRLGTVSVDDGVVTISGIEDQLTARIAAVVAETTEGVVSVQVRPSR